MALELSSPLPHPPPLPCIKITRPPSLLFGFASYSLVLLLFPFFHCGLFSLDSASSVDMGLCPGKELWFVSLGYRDSFNASAFRLFCGLAFQLELAQLSRSVSRLSQPDLLSIRVTLRGFGCSSLPCGLLLVVCRSWSCQGSYLMFWGGAFHLVCYQCLSVWFFCPGFSDVLMGGFRKT